MHRSSTTRWLAACVLGPLAATVALAQPPIPAPVPPPAPVVGPVAVVAAAKDAKDAKDGVTLLIESFIDHSDPPDVAHRHPCKIHALKLDKGALYQIDLVGHGIDTYLRLLDADGRMLVEDDDSGGNLDARIRHTTTKSGLHYIVATTFNGGEGAYTLTVRKVDVKPAKAVAMKAAAAKKPSEVQGQLTADSAVDNARSVPSQVHTITLKANKTYIIDLESSDFDAYLRLETPAGNKILEDDDSGGNLNSRIEYRIPSDGDYRLVAMPLSALNGNAGNYTLRVTEKE